MVEKFLILAILVASIESYLSIAQSKVSEGEEKNFQDNRNLF